MDPMEDAALLKKADDLACKLLNQLRNKHKTEYPLAFLTLAVMFGRLRRNVREEGTDLNYVDELFMSHAKVITEVVDQ